MSSSSSSSSSSSPFVCISSLLLVVFVLLSTTVSPSHQQHPGGQYSWMPQGRFGKRTKDELGSASVRQALLNVIRSSSRKYAFDQPPKVDVDASTMQYADVPVIASDTDGVICLRTDYIGYYKCFRESSKASSSGSTAVDVAVPVRERVVDELQ